MSERQIITNQRIETKLQTKDFFYELPPDRIAQHPAEQRDASRLMVIHRDTDAIEHRHFYDIVDYIHPEDVLVVNDSKVIPARLYGWLDDRPEASLELLLLREIERDVWECLVKPGKRARIGAVQIFGNGLMKGQVLEITEEGNRHIRFTYDRERYNSIYQVLAEIGVMPLPPYITETLSDATRYQTVYAAHNGSAAAPTAGLHFTPNLLEHLRQKGVAIAPVLLHVGLGTFRPVKEEQITDHLMHTEYISISKESAQIINERKRAGGRIICVGTTSCRTLESAADEEGVIHPISGDTGIFIYPGYRFKATDALITNFHLPESTLLMLVSAFYRRDRMLDAYRCAVAQNYRFFSFGDAMFIV